MTETDKKEEMKIKRHKQMSIMNTNLKEFLNSLKDEEISIDTTSEEDIKKIDEFVSIIIKNEKNCVDFIRYVHFSERKSILFSNAVSLHVNALKLYPNYKELYNIIINPSSGLLHKINEGINVS